MVYLVKQQNNPEREYTMTKQNVARNLEEVKGIFTENSEALRKMVQEIVQDVLNGEMENYLEAGPYERTETRRGYRAGYYTRRMETRIGTLVLRIPQDREGHFKTEIFERYQRSEKALVNTLMEMYLEGVSTRKVAHVTETLCGTEFSASTVSAISKKLDDSLKSFASRHLDDAYPYVLLDARYEKVRIDGIVQNQAVLVALGISWDGRREVLSVELAPRESKSVWKDFLIQLKERGLHGVEFVVSDDHCGIRNAVSEVLTEAVWQRCYVHFLRNAWDHLPKKHVDPDCMVELRWIYDRRTLAEARNDLRLWLAKWSDKYPSLCEWVEANIEETLTFYKLPHIHHKHLKSTNMLERMNQEIKRRTHIIRTFPNKSSCLRLIRALAVETHEAWQVETRYLNMEELKEHKKEIRFNIKTEVA